MQLINELENNFIIKKQQHFISEYKMMNENWSCLLVRSGTHLHPFHYSANQTDGKFPLIDGSCNTHAMQRLIWKLQHSRPDDGPGKDFS